MPTEDSELLNLTQSEPPPKRRLRSNSHGVALVQEYVDQDSLAAADRARCNALLNGEAPFREKDLKERGLVDMVNNNFGEARAALDDALAPYIEMNNSVARVADIQLELDDPQMAWDYSQIVSEEFDHLMREWDAFHANLNLLANYFVWDGVAWTMWQDDRTWQWEPVSLENFKVARDTKISDESIDCAAVLRNTSVSKLYQKIRDEKWAKEAGWNPEAVKQAIYHASNNRYKFDNYTQHWEEFEREIKENDLYQGDSAYKRVKMAHIYYREFDGSYTHVICNQNAGDFLYERVGKYPRANNCFVMFTYGVGTGTIHTLRGLGQKIFGTCQINNRILSQMAQAAFTAGQIHVRADAETAENFQYLQIGPYSIIPEGFEPVSLTPDNFASSTIPVYNTMLQSRQNVTGSFQSRAVTPEGRSTRSATEVRAQVQQESALGAAAMTLFFTPYNKTLRETYRRLVSREIDQRDCGGKLAMDFRARCKKRGVDIEMLRKFRSVKAVQAIGNGSPAMAEMAGEKLMQLSGGFDEEGKKNALRTVTANIQGVGYEKVDLFVPKGGPRRGYDFDIANIENGQLRAGIMPIITGEQNNYVHLEAHIPFIAEMIEAHKAGQLDDQAAVGILQPAGEHAGEHLMLLSQNNLRDADTRAMRQQLQNVMAYVDELAQQVINAMMAEQQSAQPEGGQQLSPKEQYELEMLQLKIQDKIADAERSREAHQQKMEQIRQQVALENLKGTVQLAERETRPVGRPTLVG